LPGFVGNQVTIPTMTEYVDIYYDRVLCFRRIKVDDVKGMIDGWMEGGQRRGRTYDRSKFSTKPTEFDDGTPPIAGMSRELWDEHKELLALHARDDGSALRNGFFIPEGGTTRTNPAFAKFLDANCKVRSDLGDDEVLYGIMLSIKELSPDLTESDFLAVRRAIWRYALDIREGWRRNHPNEVPRTAESRQGDVIRLRSQWAEREKAGKNQDVLTGIYETQFENARKVIAEGHNFQPELLMYRGRNVYVSFIQGPDPMTQAIAAIKQAQPEGYSFAGETWGAKLPEGKERYHKWGDIAKLDSKTEGFVQVCVENGGPYLQRDFTIDRAVARLVENPPGAVSRMPKFWKVTVPLQRPDPTAGYAYA